MKPGEARLRRETWRRRRARRGSSDSARGAKAAARGHSDVDGYALRRLLAGYGSLSSSLPHSLPCVMILARVLAGAAVWFLRNAKRWPRSECAVRPWVVGLLVVRL